MNGQEGYSREWGQRSQQPFYPQNQQQQQQHQLQLHHQQQQQHLQQQQQQQQHQQHVQHPPPPLPPGGGGWEGDAFHFRGAQSGGARASELHHQMQQQQQRQQQKHWGGAKHAELLSGQKKSSGLKVAAGEFIPKSLAGAGASASEAAVAGAEAESDLKATAGEFVPGGPVNISTEVPVENESIAQVFREGYMLLVKESDIQEHDQVLATNVMEREEGFGWAGDSSSMPVQKRRTLHSLAVPDELWTIFQQETLAMMKQLPPDDPRLKEIPNKFYGVFPLDDPRVERGSSGSFGYPSCTYKAVSEEDGHCYALRRFDNVRTSPKIVAAAVEAWVMLPAHPGIVQVREAFANRAALFFACDYYPGAQTLREHFLDKQGGLLSEPLLWNFACQLVAALRTVHSAGLACRQISPSHVLHTSGGRLRLNWMGCVDVLEFEARKQLPDMQKDDLLALGKLMLSLATRLISTAQNQQEGLAFVAQQYSMDMHNFIASLISKPQTVFDVCRNIAHHLVDSLDVAHSACDSLQGHLGHEYDNGRLLRLLLKLGTINERAEHQRNPQWAETGDCYILKLFRDFLFHQVNEENKPVMDFGHILQSLNKLDVGEPEKILLTSRDEKNILVVTFEDVKRCLDAAFHDLFGPPPAAHPQQQLQQQY